MDHTKLWAIHGSKLTNWKELTVQVITPYHKPVLVTKRQSHITVTYLLKLEMYQFNTSKLSNIIYQFTSEIIISFIYCLSRFLMSKLLQLIRFYILLLKSVAIKVGIELNLTRSANVYTCFGQVSALYANNF